MMSHVSFLCARAAMAVPPAPTIGAGNCGARNGGAHRGFIQTPMKRFHLRSIGENGKSNCRPLRQRHSTRSSERKWGSVTSQWKTQQCAASAGCVGSRERLPRQVKVVKVVSVRSLTIPFVRRVLSQPAQPWHLSKHANPTVERTCANSRAARSTLRWTCPAAPGDA